MRPAWLFRFFPSLNGAAAAFPRAYAQWVLRWPRSVLAGSLALSLGIGGFAALQRYHNPYDIWFLPDDPTLLSYRQLTRQYGSDDSVIVAFRDPEGIFTNRALAAVFDLTERLERIPSVSKVDSVASYQYVREDRNRTGEAELSIADLVRREELPLAPQELGRREGQALAEKPLVGSFLSPPERAGGRPTATALLVRTIINTPDEAVTLVEGILALARDIEVRHGYRLYLGGIPVNEHGFMSFGRSEAVRFSAVLLVTVVTLLAVVFRDPRGVILPLAVVGLSTLSALGCMALLGIWLNALTTIVPPLLITVGIAEAMHLVAKYFELRRAGRQREAAVLETIEFNFWPCAITSLTTAFGFASLLVTNVVPMRQLGLGSSVGVAFAWLVSFTVVPAALALWPDPRSARAGAGPWWADARHTWIDRALVACVRFVLPRPGKVIMGMGLVFAVLATFMAQIRVETSYVNMFKPQTMLRQGLAFIESNLGGVIDLEISLDSGRSDGVKDPLFLAKLAAIQAFLQSQPEITYTFSVADILRRVHHVMGDGVRNGQADLPDSPELSAQYLLLYTLGSSREDLKDRIEIDGRWTRLSARARVQSSGAVQDLGERVRRFIRERYPELTANVTGKSILYTSLHQEMASNAIASFLTAFVPITIVLSLLFWSLKVGVLSMVPNLFPILATAGLMGLLGIPLDPGSAMVGTVAIGIVVDDTVHFFSKYMRLRAHGLGPTAATEGTLQAVGRPVIYTAFILAFGFSVFSFSQFNFIAYFGQLAATVIVLALVADLLLTPALLLVSDSARRPLVSWQPIPGADRSAKEASGTGGS